MTPLRLGVASSGKPAGLDTFNGAQIFFPNKLLSFPYPYLVGILIKSGTMSVFFPTAYYIIGDK